MTFYTRTMLSDYLKLHNLTQPAVFLVPDGFIIQDDVAAMWILMMTFLSHLISKSGKFRVVQLFTIQIK